MKEREWKEQRSSLENRILELRPDLSGLVSEIKSGELYNLTKTLAANNSAVPKYFIYPSNGAQERTRTFLDYLTNSGEIIDQFKTDVEFEQGPDDQSVVFLLGLLDDRQYDKVVGNIKLTWQRKI